MRRSWVIFAHGSGSSRMSSRNNWEAKKLNERGYGTFLFDLLTKEEDSIYANRFNIPLLSERLLGVTQWLSQSLDSYLPKRIEETL
jgi:putative phosphoribosyl transferase